MEAVLLALAGVVALLGLGALALSGRPAIFWLGFVATLVPLGYIDRYYFDLPSSIKWLPEIAVVFAAVAAAVLVPGARLNAPRAVAWVYAAIVAEALLSLAFNRTSVAA